ncbi:MAG: alpha/beta hydrolase [Cellulomonadaceae bacterium]|nr:alpha/beta hydrolase [Cellulomonadaceae bacterium]
MPVTWLQAAKRSNGVVVFLHGGAYLGGPLEQQWRWLLEIARRVDVAAVAIRYRMPPKHPFPAALDDAGTAIRAMRDAGEIDDGNWVLSGDSAGGGLALATTRTLKDDHGILPAGLVLTAPWVDLEMRSPELLAQVPQDAFLHPLWLGRAARAYAGGVPLSDPRLSPINGSFTGFPPTHLNVGTRDLFLTDVRRLARALEVAGVPVQCIEQDGGMHTYVQDIVTPEARWTIASQSAWLSQLLSRRER